VSVHTVRPSAFSLAGGHRAAPQLVALPQAPGVPRNVEQTKRGGAVLD